MVLISADGTVDKKFKKAFFCCNEAIY